MNSQLTAIYTGLTVPDDGYWLRLDQDAVTSDVATTSDAASVLDALYDTDPCSDATTEETTDTDTADVAEDVDLEELVQSINAAAQSAGINTAICDQDADGSVEVSIKIITSHPFDDHRVRISGGELISEAQMQLSINKVVAVESSTSVTLDYPVVSGFSADWRTTFDSKPEINRNGNTLYWQGAITGTLHVRYQSMYHLATIKVAGVDGDQGEATVRCFFHGLVEEIVPDLPEPTETDTSLCSGRISGEFDSEDNVTCYRTVWVLKKCSCSKEEVGSYHYEETVPCPDTAPKRCPGIMESCMHNLGTTTVDEFVRCTNDGGDSRLSDADYYRSICCVAPKVSLPTCMEERRTWKGGAPLEKGIAHWRRVYGQNLRVVSLMPPGGICGQWTIKQVVDAKSCCDMADPVALPMHDTVMAPGITTSITVQQGTGLAPFRWMVGSGLEILSVSADTGTVWIKAAADFCGCSSISVTDNCGTEARVIVRSTVGRWVAQVVYDVYALPSGFAPGVADAAGPTDLCGSGFTIPTVRTSGEWQVIVGYSAVGFSAVCEDAPGDCGAITFISGLGMHPYTAFCERYNCLDTGHVPQGNCCVDTGVPQYVKYYQSISSLFRWEC